MRRALTSLCVSADILTGLLWLGAPALIYEWLYPELSGRAALIWVEQGGWLLLARGGYTALCSSELTRWGALWWVSAPMHAWSLSALAHLGTGGRWWHLTQLTLTLLITWVAIAQRPLSAHVQAR
jgi:hypothetical protein